MANTSNLLAVDWSKLPPPVDDGGARHLRGTALPDHFLSATSGTTVSLARLNGRGVLFAYPMTGKPDHPLPEDWDLIPGARGCTPQACAFRDLNRDLREAGASFVFGISTQSPEDQAEAALRLHLPFPLLSDQSLAFSRALRLPTMDVEGKTLLKRLAMVLDEGSITEVFYPVFPPDRNASEVLAWLKANPK